MRTEFTGEPVDDDVLLRILDAAHRAPSVGLSQPWDFVLVTDRQVRGRFAEHVAEQRQLFADDLPADRVATFGPITVDGVLASTLGIVVTSDPHRAGPHLLGGHSIPDTTLYSTCLAAGEPVAGRHRGGARRRLGVVLPGAVPVGTARHPRARAAGGVAVRRAGHASRGDP